MKTILALVLASSVAFGQAIEVKRGDLVPADGVFLSEPQAVRAAQRLAAAEAENAALKENTIISTPVFWALIAGVAVASAAATTAIVVVAKK